MAQRNPDRAAEAYKRMDKDGDGKVTLEEFKAGRPQRPGGGGGGRGPGGPARPRRKTARRPVISSFWGETRRVRTPSGRGVDLGAFGLGDKSRMLAAEP
jgi:hypothetical protein